MRRLHDEEIRRLDIINRGNLGSRRQIATYSVLTGTTVASSFTFNPRERSGSDIGGSGEAVSDSLFLSGLPYKQRHFMFTMTDNGLYLLTRRYAKEGDVVVVLDGGKVPVILRRVESANQQDPGQFYNFVCVSYVHGFMDGEAEEAVSSDFFA